MTKKFRTDKTAGGHTILSLHGPDLLGEYAGVIQLAGAMHGITWNKYGDASSGSFNDTYGSGNLVPAEPEIQYHTAYVKGLYGYEDNGNSVQLVRAHFCPGSFTAANLKLGFDAETGELLTAEVLPNV